MTDDGEFRLGANDGRLPGVCCSAKQKCCNGACCDASEACVSVPEPQFGWTDAMGDPLLYTGKSEKICSVVVITPQSGVRIVCVPLILLLLILGSYLYVMKEVFDTGNGKMSITVPCSIMTVCSIFVLFSPEWPHALVIALISLFILQRQAYATVSPFLWTVSTVYFLIFIGGVDMGSLFAINNSDMFPALSSASSGNTHANLINNHASCARYYNYFWQDANLRSWNSDPLVDYTGYCSSEWIDAVSFFVICITGAYFTLLINLFKEMAANNYSSK